MRKAIFDKRVMNIGKIKVFLIGEEITTKAKKETAGGSIDLVGLDKRGRIYIIELKNKRDTRTTVFETIFQPLMYRSQIKHINFKNIFDDAIKDIKKKEDLNIPEKLKKEYIKALDKHKLNKRRHFATIAMLHDGMKQIDNEKNDYNNLLKRQDRDIDIVAVACVEWINKEYTARWLAGMPKSYK